jgi:hypothetical protein
MIVPVALELFDAPRRPLYLDRLASLQTRMQTRVRTQTQTNA